MPCIEIAIDNLPLDKPVRLESERSGIVVIRTSCGIHAYRDVCPHAGWRLSDGQVRNGILQCPGHGWEYEVATGTCEDVPAYNLKPIPVVHLGDRVRFEWNAAEKVLARLQVPPKPVVT